MNLFFCEKCKRLSASKTKCPYCNGKEFKDLLFENTKYKNIDIKISSLEIDKKKYKIKGIIGKGGTAVILELEDSSGSRYALKAPFIFLNEFTNVIHDADDLNNSNNVITKEIEIIKKIKDAYSLKIHFIGKIEIIHKKIKIVIPVILMDKIACNLRELFAELNAIGRDLGYDEKTKLILSIMNNIIVLHEAKGLHRDLAPDNIFLVKDLKSNKIDYLIADLGSGKKIDIMMSNSSGMFNHGLYSSPECRDDEGRYNVRQDIYSMGVIITDVIIGNEWIKYFDTKNLKIENIKFEREILPQIKKILRPEFYRILSKATKYKHEKRYSNAKDMYDEILYKITEFDTFFKKNAIKTIIINVKREMEIPGEIEGIEEIKYSGNKVIKSKKNRKIRIFIPGKIIKKVSIRKESLFTAEKVTTRNIIIKPKEKLYKELKEKIHTATLGCSSYIKVEYQDEN